MPRLFNDNPESNQFATTLTNHSLERHSKHKYSRMVHENEPQNVRENLFEFVHENIPTKPLTIKISLFSNHYDF